MHVFTTLKNVVQDSSSRYTQFQWDAHPVAAESAEVRGRRAVAVVVLHAPQLAPLASASAGAGAGGRTEQHTDHVLLRLAERHELVLRHEHLLFVQLQCTV